MRLIPALALTLLTAAPLAAQMPPPAPGPTLEKAQKAAAAAFKACRGTPIAVAILDSAGGVKLLEVGDGGRGLFADFARRKAATALKFGKPSAAVRDEAKTNPDLARQLTTDPTLIGFGGGVPYANGAIAAGGAPSQDTDERCARAGLAVLERR